MHSEQDKNELEVYLTTNLTNSDSQVMARTKQTANKSQLPKNPFVSGGGLPLAARSPRHSPRFDSDSSLDRSPRMPLKTARRSSPRKGVANHTGLTTDEGESSGMSTRSKRSGNEDDDDSTKVENKDNATAKHPSKPAYQPLPAKNLKKVARVVKPKQTMKELCRTWNKSASTGLVSETAHEWLIKTEKKRNTQNQVLRKAKPGMKALREIKFYQSCQSFLIQVIPFQRLVREVCDEQKFDSSDPSL